MIDDFFTTGRTLWGDFSLRPNRQRWVLLSVGPRYGTVCHRHPCVITMCHRTLSNGNWTRISSGNDEFRALWRRFWVFRRSLLMTNLIHYFTAVIFSVKFAIFQDKFILIWISVKSVLFREFRLILLHLWPFSDFYKYVSIIQTAKNSKIMNYSEHENYE